MILTAQDWPEYLRTMGESQSIAAETAMSAFVLNPSVDAVIYCNSLMLVEDDECNGLMDFDMAARFGAAA